MGSRWIIVFFIVLLAAMPFILAKTSKAGQEPIFRLDCGSLDGKGKVRLSVDGVEYHYPIVCVSA